MLGAHFRSVRSAIPRVFWGEGAGAEAPFVDCNCVDYGQQWAFFSGLLAAPPLKMRPGYDHATGV
jgi:hypothetical protein